MNEFKGLMMMDCYDTDKTMDTAGACYTRCGTFERGTAVRVTVSAVQEWYGFDIAVSVYKAHDVVPVVTFYTASAANKFFKDCFVAERN